MVVNHMLTCMNDLRLVIYMLSTCYVLIFESVHEKLLQKLLRKIENLLEICKFPVRPACADGITVGVMPRRPKMLW